MALENVEYTVLYSVQSFLEYKYFQPSVQLYT